MPPPSGRRPRFPRESRPRWCPARQGCFSALGRSLVQAALSSVVSPAGITWLRSRSLILSRKTKHRDRTPQSDSNRGQTRFAAFPQPQQNPGSPGGRARGPLSACFACRCPHVRRPRRLTDPSGGDGLRPGPRTGRLKHAAMSRRANVIGDGDSSRPPSAEPRNFSSDGCRYNVNARKFFTFFPQRDQFTTLRSGCPRSARRQASEPLTRISSRPSSE